MCVNLIVKYYVMVVKARCHHVQAIPISFDDVGTVF